jgi:hypothetical protein
MRRRPGGSPRSRCRRTASQAPLRWVPEAAAVQCTTHNHATARLVWQCEQRGLGDHNGAAAAAGGAGAGADITAARCASPRQQCRGCQPPLSSANPRAHQGQGSHHRTRAAGPSQRGSCYPLALYPPLVLCFCTAADTKTRTSGEPLVVLQFCQLRTVAQPDPMCRGV